MSDCGIYEILCLSTGQRYIGQSIDVHGRFISHRCDLRAGLHPNKPLQAAWDAHGEDSFEFRMLEATGPDRGEMTERERHHVDRLKSLDPSAVFNARMPARPMETEGTRPVTLALTPELWDQLKEIERETGARPSVTTRRALEQFLGRPKPGATHPAA